MRLNQIIKWVSVVITIFAAVTISLKITDVSNSYIFFFIGHIIMFFIMLKEKDWSLFFMNSVWIFIDIVGFIQWSK